jgi:predicted DNA-binding protein (UPF0251 family)
MSLIENNPALNIAIPVKTKRISKRLQEAIRLLMTPECKTQRDAAKKLGMSETYLSEALRKPETRVFIERTARENVAIGTLRASTVMIDLIDCDSSSTRFDASKHVLAIAGIKPSADTQVSVNIDIKAGWVIDLTDDKRPPMIDVSHKVLTDASSKSE